MFGQVVDIQVDEPPPTAHPDLTPRQTEVLRLLELGRSTNQIAAELHLSVETVRNHIRHILRALGVNSRLEAVALTRRGHLSRNRASGRSAFCAGNSRTVWRCSIATPKKSSPPSRRIPHHSRVARVGPHASTSRNRTATAP